MSLVVENIPDPDVVHRQIDSPSMYKELQGFVWEVIFQFPKENPHESLVWSKYATDNEDIWKLGLEKEAIKQKLNPSFRYMGFISSTAAAIRGIKTARGHGFSVLHKPDEGIWHAAIYYDPNKKNPWGPSDRTELKQQLLKVFSTMIECKERRSEEASQDDGAKKDDKKEV